MGTKVDCKSYLPGYYSMRDLNEDSSSSSWPTFYGDNGVTNGQYYNGFVPRTPMDGGYPGYDKDSLKQKMLEHEAVFKNQVYELHRLYRVQKDMMEEVKGTQSVGPSSSSSPQGSQFPSEDPRKWHMAGFPLSNSGPSVSPLSCTKGYDPQYNGAPFQNGVKQNGVMDSRPLKVRKKLFDLQLPGDEYNDDSDEGGKRNQNSAPGSSARNSFQLADLNEPIPTEEAMAPSPVNFLGQTSVNREAKSINHPYAKSTSHSVVAGETACIRDKFSIESSMESKNERERLFHLYEAGSSKSNPISVSQSYWQEKLPVHSYPVQGMVYPLHHPSGTHPTGYNREDPYARGLESSHRIFDRPNNSHIEPVKVSQAPNSFPFFSSSFASSRPQKVNAFESSSSFSSAAAMDRCLPFSGRWMTNSSSRLNPNSTSEMTTPNGFDYRDGSRGNNIASDRSTNHGFGKSLIGSIAGPKPPLDFNLNEVSKISPTKEVSGLPWLKPKIVHGNEALDRTNCKTEVLRDLNKQFSPKEASDCEIVEREKKIVETRKVQKILGIPIFELKKEPSSLVSTLASVNEGKAVNSERRSRIIDINLECEPDELFASEEEQYVQREKQNNGTSIRDQIDLNSCLSDLEDPPGFSQESKYPRGKIPLVIDLEAPVLLESDDDIAPLQENKANEVSLQLFENENIQIQDDALRKAAEMVLDISSYCPQILVEEEPNLPSEAPTMESFLSFVETVTSCGNEIDNMSGGSLLGKNGDIPEEIDEFEAMTLQLVEMKEEEYMPVPFVPEFPKIEDSGTTTVATRPRRGQARRGRQRRDFQRDILPGLVSLSRHEVTEDIQIFGGMMKATGHSWNSGLMRRNGTRSGAGRGRRRVVADTITNEVAVSPACAPSAQSLNVETGLEDRSLTGWGKTTRRPRRQRCAPGNSPTIVLT